MTCKGTAPSWRQVRAELHALGGAPVRTRGSHEMWRLADGEMFVVVRNHLAASVPVKVLGQLRRLKARREPEEPVRPWIRWTTVVQRVGARRR